MLVDINFFENLHILVIVIIRISLDQKLAMAKCCSDEGVVAGAKAAIVSSFATVVPTLASVRMPPWARTNLNPTSQVLITSTVAGATYIIVVDKTVLTSARKNSFKDVN
ncbi:early nodulin-93-like [Dioscorea cayenensis subsp. rotundata]|uniref:Early nodulin-93-like n=1 Tax=Dioscorea cayennensis subsp. rotundata TaxID=55577 RepID=A0AB40CN36_DIOCR|nr:early nodulin-93-like [Dioscorea cayenensis subsp. rotundata]